MADCPQSHRPRLHCKSFLRAMPPNPFQWRLYPRTSGKEREGIKRIEAIRMEGKHRMGGERRGEEKKGREREKEEENGEGTEVG